MRKLGRLLFSREFLNENTVLFPGTCRARSVGYDLEYGPGIVAIVVEGGALLPEVEEGALIPVVSFDRTDCSVQPKGFPGYLSTNTQWSPNVEP